MKSLESEIDDLLSFYEVELSPEEKRGRDAQALEKAQAALWRRIRRSNLIERAFVEVRRRTSPVGVFGNRSSIERILHAVFLHLTAKGQQVPSLLLIQRA